MFANISRKQPRLPFQSDIKEKFLSLMVIDTRNAQVTNDVNPLRINISQARKTAALPLNIQLATRQWDAKAEKVQNHTQAMLLNKIIASKKVEVDSKILKLQDEGELASMSAVEIRDYVLKKLTPADTPKHIKKPKDF